MPERHREQQLSEHMKRNIAQLDVNLERGMMTSKEYAEGVESIRRRHSDLTDELDPWFLGLLGEEYGIGGLIDDIGFSSGLAGLVQRIEREIGANILGEVAGYEKVRTTIPTALETIDKHSGGRLADFGEKLRKHPAIQIVSYYLRLGHLYGLRTFQEMHGLSVVNRILANHQEKQQPNFEGLIRQLEGCYEAMPEQLKDQAKRHVQNHALYQSLFNYFGSRESTIEVPNEDRLFYQTRTIEPERRIHFAPVGLLSMTLGKFQNIVAVETFNRLERWTRPK